MPEMRRMQCPSCDEVNVPLAVVDGITEYRCRGCGLVFYGPCGCDTTRTSPSALQGQPDGDDERLGDWQMSTPAVVIDEAARTKRYLGCP